MSYFFNAQKCQFLAGQYRANARGGCFQELEGQRGQGKQAFQGAQPPRHLSGPSRLKAVLKRPMGEELLVMWGDFRLRIWSSSSTSLAQPQGLCHLLEFLHHLSQTQGWKKLRKLIQFISFSLPQLSIQFVARFLEISVLRKAWWHTNMKRRGRSGITLDEVNTNTLLSFAPFGLFCWLQSIIWILKMFQDMNDLEKYGFFHFTAPQACCVLERRTEGRLQEPSVPLTQGTTRGALWELSRI